MGAGGEGGEDRGGLSTFTGAAYNRPKSGICVQLDGILRFWDEERGFGFISPTHGGAELFVHISAFPRDGSRPVKGESLIFELGRGRNGKPQAVRVVRQVIGARAIRPRAGIRHTKRPGSPSWLTFTALFVVACLLYGYSQFTKYGSFRSSTVLTDPVKPQPFTQNTYRCDGRTYCSQMTSCAEATYFLRNCPGVKMDGNNDGMPCEQQWCK